MLERVRDLKVQFNNDTLDSNDRNAIASEVLEIANEVKDITTNTKFNGTSVFDNSFTFQVGANQGETIALNSSGLSQNFTNGGISSVTALAGGTVAAVSTALSGTGALGVLSDIDQAIINVSKVRSSYGAIQNRLEHRLTNLATYQENLTASESRIRDVDMASEMTKFTKLQILQQAGTSMLAQANQSSQGVLSLLR